MPKTVIVRLTEEEHEEFVAACKKIGTHRQFFAKGAVLDKVRKINDKNAEE